METQQDINQQKNNLVLDKRIRFLMLVCAGLGFLGGLIGAGFVYRANNNPQTVLPGLAPLGQNIANPVSSDPVVNVVDQAGKAVVAITISREVPQVRVIPFDPFGNSFFDSPLRLSPDAPDGPVQKQEVGGGSGFIVDPDGLIITNKHVVSDGKATYSVTFKNGETVSAKVVALDPLYDLALLKVNKTNLPTVKFANSDSLKVGQSVIAIGNALGQFPNTVSAGIVSGLGRQIQAGDIMTGQVETLNHVIQTDAAINPGNSGGPLLNLSGEAVGVNTAVAGSAENISFAIPSNEAARVVSDYKSDGKVVRAILGVRYQIITPEIKAEKNLSVDSGALVIKGSGPNESAVVPGSGAEKAGLKEGDIILKVDGTDVTQERTLQTFVNAKRPGQTMSLTVMSGGQQKTVNVILTEAK